MIYIYIYIGHWRVECNWGDSSQKIKLTRSCTKVNDDRQRRTKSKTTREETLSNEDPEKVVKHVKILVVENYK